MFRVLIPPVALFTLIVLAASVQAQCVCSAGGVCDCKVCPCEATKTMTTSFCYPGGGWQGGGGFPGQLPYDPYRGGGGEPGGFFNRPVLVRPILIDPQFSWGPRPTPYGGGGYGYAGPQGGYGGGTFGNGGGYGWGVGPQGGTYQYDVQRGGGYYPRRR